MGNDVNLGGLTSYWEVALFFEEVLPREKLNVKGSPIAIFATAIGIRAANFFYE